MGKMFAIFTAVVAAIVAGIAGLIRLARRREDVDWEDAHRPGKLVVVDGVSIHYLENAPPTRGSRGNVPNIVMVHGFGGHTFSFREQLAEFGKDYRAVAFDLKGFGYSERSPNGDYSLTEQARLILGAMDALAIDKATVIGHSMGGEVAMRMATSAPDRVEKLVLAASVSGQRVPTMPRLPFMKPFVPLMARLSAMNAWRKLFYDRSSVDQDAIRKGYLAPARVRASGNTIWEMFADLRHDQPIDYPRITMPVLILAAEKERIIPFHGRALRYLRKRLPQAELVTVPRSGHLLLEENPRDANEAIRRFLGDKPRQAPVSVDQVPQLA